VHNADVLLYRQSVCKNLLCVLLWKLYFMSYFAAVDDAAVSL